MLILALDLSGRSQSAALVRDGSPLVEHTWPAPRFATGSPAGGPLAVVGELCAAAGLGLDAVELVAVTTGPGSFNGIRAGIATAEGLALALGIPVVGAPTLDALSYQLAGRGARVVALRPAGRGEYYAALYAGDWSHWRRHGDYVVGPAEVVLDGLDDGTLVCGVLDAAIAGVAAKRGLAVAPPVYAWPRATFVAALAGVRWADPEFDRASSLQPQYLRRPGITRSSRPRGLAAAGLAAAATIDALSGE